MNVPIQNTGNESYRFEVLFNHASMGIVMVNSKGCIHSVNPFALNLFGYTVEEVMNKSIEMLIPRRYHDKHTSHRKRYIHHPNSRPMGVGMDLFAIKKDGTEIPVEVSLGSYQHDGDKHVIAFISDISIRKKAEAEIEKLNNELEATVQQRTMELTHAMHQLERSKENLSKLLHKEKELGELKSRFVSMASHEFRTPLSTILSSTYLVEKYTTTDDQPKRAKHVQRIISSVHTLTDILNDFLSVDRMEEGKIQVKYTTFSIQELVSTVAVEMENTLKKNQKISYHHEGGFDVLLDASLLKHIVMNLISNASKFSQEESPIEIKTSHRDHCIILSVKDYGIGISNEDQTHLMERFFRGANASNIQGTGLGLHIVSQYAKLMNGKLECKSELEKGTEFVVRFNKKNDHNEKNFID